MCSKFHCGSVRCDLQRELWLRLPGFCPAHSRRVQAHVRRVDELLNVTLVTDTVKKLAQ